LAPTFGFTRSVHELDAKKGDKHRMLFRNFATGQSHSFDGIDLKRVPGETLVYNAFDDPNRPVSRSPILRSERVSASFKRQAVFNRFFKLA
jgi:uncharacterized protein YndB with AHSA1/START domain